MVIYRNVKITVQMLA